MSPAKANTRRKRATLIATTRRPLRADCGATLADVPSAVATTSTQAAPGVSGPLAPRDPAAKTARETSSARSTSLEAKNSPSASIANRNVAGYSLDRRRRPVDDGDWSHEGTFWQRPVAWYHY
jgi:hypothetical protein